MIGPEEPEKKKSLLDKLPKLGKTSQFVLLIGIFLILFIPLWMYDQQQPPKQAELEHELSLLQTILESPTTKGESLQSEINQVEAELEAARGVYPDPSQSPEIIDRLLEMAESNDIDVTKTKVSITTRKIGAMEYPVLTFDMGLTGQVAKFENLILDVSDAFPTSEISVVKMTVTEQEGEEDTASMVIDIFCYKGG